MASADVSTALKKQMLLLGNPSIGKTTFLKSQYDINPTTNILLNYNHVTHRDPSTEELLADIGTYTISEDIDLVIESLCYDFHLDAQCCIFLDYRQPHLMLGEIERWLSFLLNVTDRTIKRQCGIDEADTVFVPSDNGKMQVAYEALKVAQDQLQRYMQLFKDMERRDYMVQQEASTQLPLNEGALALNVGLPLHFVITHVDRQSTMMETYSVSPTTCDLVLQAVRKVALTLGASVFAVHDDATRQNFYGYLLHRMSPTAFPWTTTIEGLQLMQLAIPAGWDSLGKVQALCQTENLNDSFLVQLSFDGTHQVGISGKSYIRHQFVQDKETSKVTPLHIGYPQGATLQGIRSIVY